MPAAPWRWTAPCRNFAAAAAPLGDRLSIHNQPNLGGSGGYSRVMYEALNHTDCEQILFMDDDIRIEPDSILRALALNHLIPDNEPGIGAADWRAAVAPHFEGTLHVGHDGMEIAL